MSYREKKILRATYKDKRDSLTDVERRTLSAEIAQHLFEGDLWNGAKSLTCFVSFANEVETLPIIQKAIDDGKRLFVPKVDKEKDILVFYQLTDPKTGLSVGTYGIPEPVSTIAADPSEPVLHLIPGLIFDRHGHRIGYGKGYYDAYLKKTSPYALKVALAFGFQLIEAIPHTKDDVMMDAIITESGTTYFEHPALPDDSEFEF